MGITLNSWWALPYLELTLGRQGLEKMENLCLPGLRELYLHQNKITRIEGLQG